MMDSLERTIKNGLNTVQYNQVEACLKVLKNDGKNKKGQKIAKLLAPILDDDDCILSNKIKNTICECLEIVAPEKAAEYLTRKILKDETATTAAISKRLYDLRENLPKSADRFIAQPSFLENAAGKKLLAWLLGQEEREARQIVRAQLATGRRGEKLAKAYGECFFLALKNYQNIIIDELQNWVRAALYSENEYVAQRAAVLFRSAVPDRRDDKRAFVDEASYAALAPLLWRSLRCANGKIRTRAILLLGIAFPVFSDDVDAAIEEQLKMISTMITDDPLPTARAAACRALAQVIHAFGALIPQSQLIHIAKNTLASTAARDISHFSVREAAILAIGEILPQLQNANASILDALAPCVHDVHPKCRAACLKALRAQSKLSGQQLPSRLLGMYRAAQNSKASKKLAASAAKVLLNCENESLAQRVRRALALAKNDLAATRVLYARHVVSIYGAPESAKLAVALVAAATAAYAGTLRKKKKKRDRGGQDSIPQVEDGTNDARLLVAIAAELCDGPTVESSLRDYVQAHLNIDHLKSSLAGNADLGRLCRVKGDTSHDFETSDARSVVLACQRDPVTWIPKLIHSLEDQNDPLPASIAVAAINAALTQADWLNQVTTALQQLRQRALALDDLFFNVDLPALVEAECAAVLLSYRTDATVAQHLNAIVTDLLNAGLSNSTKKKRARRTQQHTINTEERDALLVLALEILLAALLSAEPLGVQCHSAACNARVQIIDALNTSFENYNDHSSQDEDHPLLELVPHLLKLCRGQPEALVFAITLDDPTINEAFITGTPPLDAHDELLDDLASAFDTATLLMNDQEKLSHFQNLILPLCKKNALPISTIRHTFLNEDLPVNDHDEHMITEELPSFVQDARPPPPHTVLDAVPPSPYIVHVAVPPPTMSPTSAVPYSEHHPQISPTL